MYGELMILNLLKQCRVYLTRQGEFVCRLNPKTMARHLGAAPAAGPSVPNKKNKSLRLRNFQRVSDSAGRNLVLKLRFSDPIY